MTFVEAILTLLGIRFLLWRGPQALWRLIRRQPRTAAGTAQDSSDLVGDGVLSPEKFLRVGDVVEVASPQIGVLRIVAERFHPLPQLRLVHTKIAGRLSIRTPRSLIGLTASSLNSRACCRRAMS